MDFIAKWLFENTGEFIYLGLIPVIASAVVVIFAIIISNLARRRKSSFLVLTEETRKYREKIIRKEKRRLWKFGIWFIASIASSVVGAMMYAYVQ